MEHVPSQKPDESLVPSERVELLPEWNKDSPFYKWASNFTWRNQWRVEHVFGCDKEDMMAEIALMWVQCCKRYGDSVNSNAQMMYLFQLWVTGQFHDYATKDTKNRNTMEKIALRDISIKSEAELAVKLDEASSDLKRVLDIFINAPQEILEVLKEDTKGWTAKQFLQKVCGYVGVSQEKSKQLIKELQELLS